jgi:putative NADH-flavin reductase
LNILVFGATGGTGLELVKQGLHQGHRMTAFVRNPSRLQVRHAALSIIQGDVMNRSQVEVAVKDQDAVISSIGVTRRTPITVCSEGTKNIIAAMKAYHINRLIVESAYAAGNTRKGFYGNLLWILIRGRIQDKEVMENAVEQSGLDWIIARPVWLTNGPLTGAYRVGFDIPVSIMPKISRADVADWMLKQVTENKFVHTAPTITY